MSDRDLRRLLEIVGEEQSILRANQVERRREELREALFFLELLRPVRAGWLSRWLRIPRALADYCPFALRQVAMLIAARPRVSPSDQHIGGMLHGARALVDEEPAPASPGGEPEAAEQALAVLERVNDVFAAWQRARLSEALEEDEPEEAGPFADADEDDRAVALVDCMSRAAWVRRRIYQFLELSELVEQSPPRRFLRYRWPDLVRFAAKNLALLCVLPVVAFVAFRVEAVNSLLRNDPGFTLLAMAIAALPPVVGGIWILLRRSSVDPASGEAGAEVPAWDVGGRSFRSLRWAAVGPERSMRRWPRARKLLDRLAELAGRGSDEPGPGDAAEVRKLARGFLTLSAQGGPGILRAIHLAQAVQLLAVFGWWIAGGLLVQRLTDPAQPFLTSYVIVVSLGALLLLAHQVDFLDHLYELPVRLRLLLAGIGALLLVILAKEALFPWLFGLLAVCFLIRWVLERSRVLQLVVAIACLAVAVLTGVKEETNEREVWQDSGPPLARLSVLDESGAACRDTPEWPLPPPGRDADSASAGAEPVVLLAASGGGSRAAVYTGLTLLRLHGDFPRVARRLQAISSVSGGSLANAAYTVRRLEAAGPALDPRLEEMVEALRGDFLRPTLKGATVQVGTSRGRAIEEHWQRQETGRVALGEWTIGDLIERWRRDAAEGAAAPRFPLPLFNTSTLDSHDVVISPLERSFYTRADQPTAVALADDATWVHDRDGIYGLEDLLPGYDPGLAEAVRASANFPFGFPLVTISTRKPLAFSPLASDRKADSPKTVHLTDGGALSNSGMWPLFNLLSHRCLLDQLRERGVLLIVVDAGKMPVYPAAQRKYGTLWSAIGDQAPIAQALHRRGLDYLQLLYEDRLAVLQIDLLADLRHNVLTTWALSDRSYKILERSFDTGWETKRVHLCEKWLRLTGVYPSQEACAGWLDAADTAVRGELVDRQRPPLD